MYLIGQHSSFKKNVKLTTTIILVFSKVTLVLKGLHLQLDLMLLDWFQQRGSVRQLAVNK